MPSLSAARAANASLARPYRPVALFLGGTSGIGEGMARAFAQHAQGDADVVIIGRNRAAGERILASLPTATNSPAPRREFVQCDATLMKNVREAAREIKGRVERVNYVVMSPGILTLNGRDETEEGIDRKLALHYYARWAFLHEIAPLLRKAQDAGQGAKVMSVMAAGVGGPIDKHDLGLKNHYSLSGAAQSVATYNDCMIESFAERYPTISFTHSAPGVVRTNIMAASPSPVLRLFHPLVSVFTSILAVSPADCAEHMLHGLYNAPAGATRYDSHGDDLKGKGIYHGEEEKRVLWEHTVQETGVAAKMAEER